MASVTYFVVVPFEQTEDGDYFALEPIEARSAEAARFRARALADAGKGAVAFCRTGDPDLGEYSEGVVLAALGTLPEQFEDYLSR